MSTSDLPERNAPAPNAPAPPTPTFDHLGPPEWWTCPHCRQSVLLYPALPNNHRCLAVNAGFAGPRVFWFYYVMDEDHRVRSLHLVGADDADPLLRVEGFDSGGMVQRWHKRAENGELVFYPFDPELSREHLLGYSPHIQRHEPIPRAELERRAIRGRHSG